MTEVTFEQADGITVPCPDMRHRENNRTGLTILTLSL